MTPNTLSSYMPVLLNLFSLFIPNPPLPDGAHLSQKSCRRNAIEVLIIVNCISKRSSNTTIYNSIEDLVFSGNPEPGADESTI